jgi:Zn-dependent protease/CBS domain-containing protein
MHATFPLLIAFVFLSYWWSSHDVAQTLEGVAFVVLLFVCVVLHEFGHALMAARHGIKTRDITLLPIGGVARLERMPEEPIQELWVALAGPAVNVVIAAAIFVWLRLTATFAPLDQLTVTSGPFLARLMVINIVLVVFNMLPAFPMDGGRVLRALLATRIEYGRATQIAASIGQVMAMLFGIIGFFINPFLILIAIFVWFGAAQDAAMTTMKVALGGIPVKRGMMTNFHSFHPTDPLQRAIELTLATPQQDFPDVENDRVVGILPSRELLAALHHRGPETLVRDVMRHDNLPLDAKDMLDGALARIRAAAGCTTSPVVRGGALIGLLTATNVSEFLLIVSALDERRAGNAAVTS